MIIKEGTKLGMKTKIRTPEGKVLKYVKEFNTETKQATLYAVLVYKHNGERVAVLGEDIRGEEREVVTFSCHLLGHKAYNTETGEEIK